MTTPTTRTSRVEAIRASCNPSFEALNQGQNEIKAALRHRGESIDAIRNTLSELKETLESGTKANPAFCNAKPSLP